MEMPKGIACSCKRLNDILDKSRSICKLCKFPARRINGRVQCTNIRLTCPQSWSLYTEEQWETLNGDDRNKNNEKQNIPTEEGWYWVRCKGEEKWRGIVQALWDPCDSSLYIRIGIDDCPEQECLENTPYIFSDKTDPPVIK